MLKPLFALALLVAIAHAAPPAVQLSDDHQQMSTVKVGDAWPALALKTTAGAEAKWAEQQGAKATVVGVTTAGGWMSKGLRKDLAADIATPLADEGVKAVAITVGPPPPSPSSAQAACHASMCSMPLARSCGSISSTRTPAAGNLRRRWMSCWRSS